MSNISVALPEYFGTFDEETLVNEQERQVYEYIDAVVKTEFSGQASCYDVMSGASKLVIIPETYTGRVIKLPFSCSLRRVPHDIDLSVFEEGKNYIKLEDSYYWYRHYELAYGEIHDNYCNAEVEIYNQVPEEFKCFFAYTEFKEVDNLEYYIQETCISFDDLEDNDEINKKFSSVVSNKVASKEVRSKNDDYLFFDPKWLAYAEDFYGTEKVLKFLQWLENDGDMIDDMHEGNYGFAFDDGRPVLIDFSNFCD